MFWKVCLLFCVAAPVIYAQVCRHGDSPYYIINGRRCNQIGSDRWLCYDAKVRRECCATCARLKIANASPDCEWGDRSNGCGRLTADDCRIPSNNQACCRSCQGTAPYCRNHEFIQFNGYKCDEFIRYKGAHNCYQPDVINNCCETCSRHKTRSTIPGCTYGDRKMKIFTERQTGVRYSCQHLNQGFIHKCEDARVLEDCCATCGRYISSGRRFSSSRSGQSGSSGSSSRTTESRGSGSSSGSSSSYHSSSSSSSGGGQWLVRGSENIRYSSNTGSSGSGTSGSTTRYTSSGSSGGSLNPSYTSGGRNNRTYIIGTVERGHGGNTGRTVIGTGSGQSGSGGTTTVHRTTETRTWTSGGGSNQGGSHTGSGGRYVTSQGGGDGRYVTSYEGSNRGRYVTSQGGGDGRYATSQGGSGGRYVQTGSSGRYVPSHTGSSSSRGGSTHYTSSGSSGSDGRYVQGSGTRYETSNTGSNQRRYGNSQGGSSSTRYTSSSSSSSSRTYTSGGSGVSGSGGTYTSGGSRVSGSGSTIGGGHTVTGGCVDNKLMRINGQECADLIRGGRHHCYLASVQRHCCASCAGAKLRSYTPGCEYGDRNSMVFTDHLGNEFRCGQLRGSWLEKCNIAMVKENCCVTCRGYSGGSQQG